METIGLDRKAYKGAPVAVTRDSSGTMAGTLGRMNDAPSKPERSWSYMPRQGMAPTERKSLVAQLNEEFNASKKNREQAVLLKMAADARKWRNNE